MAAKKKAAAAKATKKAAAPKAAKAAPPSIAVKTLGELPAVDHRLRAAYKSAFSDEQCDAWGELTKAKEVLAEAGRWVTAMSATLKKGPVGGYSLRRLAYLCELLVQLEDEIEKTSDAGQRSGARRSATHLALKLKQDLLNRLYLIVGGRLDLRALITDRDEPGDSPQTIRDSLTGLIDLASRWRRDPVIEMLADDADLAEVRLNAAYNALENLTRADEDTADLTQFNGGDTPSVNRIEGRVLRELKLAQDAFEQGGVKLAASPALAKVFKRGEEKKVTVVTPPPPPPDAYEGEESPEAQPS